MAKVAFLGLGVMGYPMAGHLVASGHDVTVYNRTPTKVKKWLEEYQAIAEEKGVSLTGAITPAEAARGQDIVFACVGADKDILHVCMAEDGAFGAMEKGAVFVDHTTVSADAARTLEKEAQGKGLGFIDAPVSGGEAGAVNGILTVMCGGEIDAFNQVSSVMKAYGRMIKRIGPAGAGQTAKMVNQVCIAGVVQGLSEGLHLAQKAGLDAKAVVEVISKGAAGSWQMENRANTMIDGEFDFGFAVDWMRKDLAIVLEEAKRLGLDLPVTTLVDSFYADVQALGGNRQDTSSLIRRFED
ncbi:NAD(P)-dependent oxidoreductase [Temperatibacter marinus]|uniref:NAD(P)-dependent oxidoreductase n=1 Tax=Temperatibacter marinus TaxID=1456591 RepID=A0AA52EBU1_9PROT|nr:NAD(P)-dependent oxidoreductase [Temperatibacter marinus]WND02477.1 NAD(P)-dependent oxidoreductase [Temperatibacter marinus]